MQVFDLCSGCARTLVHHPLDPIVVHARLNDEKVPFACTVDFLRVCGCRTSPDTNVQAVKDTVLRYNQLLAGHTLA